MINETSKKTVTVFKLPKTLKKTAEEEAKSKDISFSKLLSDKLAVLLKVTSDIHVDRLEKRKSELTTTSVSLPEGILKSARYKALDCKCSLADIFRHCLENK